MLAARVIEMRQPDTPEQIKSRDGRVMFLTNEVELALTFALIASQAKADSEKRRRNRANARLAYDTLVRYRLHLPTTDDFRQKFRRLQQQLRSIGECL